MTDPANSSAEQSVEIVNRLGLHARAAARLVTLAAKYRAEIRVSKDGKTVSGKSIMGVLMLAAAQGSRLTLSATGDDAIEALEALAALIARRFDEES